MLPSRHARSVASPPPSALEGAHSFLFLART
jgi:hypothetical protein